MSPLTHTSTPPTASDMSITPVQRIAPANWICSPVSCLDREHRARQAAVPVRGVERLRAHRRVEVAAAVGAGRNRHEHVAGERDDRDAAGLVADVHEHCHVVALARGVVGVGATWEERDVLALARVRTDQQQVDAALDLSDRRGQRFVAGQLDRILAERRDGIPHGVRRDSCGAHGEHGEHDAEDRQNTEERMPLPLHRMARQRRLPSRRGRLRSDTAFSRAGFRPSRCSARRWFPRSSRAVRSQSRSGHQWRRAWQPDPVSPGRSEPGRP